MAEARRCKRGVMSKNCPAAARLKRQLKRYRACATTLETLNPGKKIRVPKICAYVTAHPKRKKPHHMTAVCESFGITVEDYDKMLVAQGGVCAVCKEGPKGRNFRLAIDHCHGHGRVRGLLCSPCNLRLGMYEAKREGFETYLQQYGGGNPLIYGQVTKGIENGQNSA